MLDTHVSDHRGASSSPVGIQGALQLSLDHRTPGLPNSRPGAKRRLYYRGDRGMIIYKPLSKKPRAVQT